MKVLDAGAQPLTNADVLAWITSKRAQHTSEDAADRAKKLKPSPRPANFLTALKRTERELSSSKYPYLSNPSVYSAENCVESKKKFDLEVENAMMDRLEEGEAGEKFRKGEISEGEFEKLQESKCLSEMEGLMVFNAAPRCVEMLQPMIEGCEERFEVEEQELILEVVGRVLRRDENKETG